MSVLIYCLPALGWGLMPVISKKAGGDPVEQILGTTVAAFLVAILLNAFMEVHYTTTGIVASLISGIFWAGGQFLQFKALKQGTVSKVMPVSNGTQLVFTGITSGLLLREWRNLQQAAITLILMLVIVFAMVMITKKTTTIAEGTTLDYKTILLICASSMCLVGYVISTNFLGISGLQIFLPQATAMLASSLVITAMEKKRPRPILVSRNLLTGASWSMANIAIFYTSTRLGVGLSYTISQLCIIVSIIGGIVFLRERKTKSELINTAVGIVLFFASIVGLSQFK